MKIGKGLLGAMALLISALPAAAEGLAYLHNGTDITWKVTPDVLTGDTRNIVLTLVHPETLEPLGGPVTLPLPPPGCRMELSERYAALVPPGAVLGFSAYQLPGSKCWNYFWLSKAKGDNGPLQCFTVKFDSSRSSTSWETTLQDFSIQSSAVYPFSFHALKPNHLSIGPKVEEAKEETKSPAPPAPGKAAQSTACVIL
jgi:hypothetical protein